MMSVPQIPLSAHLTIGISRSRESVKLMLTYLNETLIVSALKIRSKFDKIGLITNQPLCISSISRAFELNIQECLYKYLMLFSYSLT